MTQPNKNTAVETVQERRLRLAEKAKQIDAAAAGAMELFHGAEVSTEKELALACAVVDLRAALTPEVMEPIMSLMNSPLGFLTDRDPSKPTMKDGKYETPKPYPVEVVRDCVIAAKMLGFRVVGNEMNIISGKFYPAKSGFRRKLTDGKSFPGLTDFRDTYDVPRMSQGGATVKAKATWLRYGKPDSMEVELAVRLNAGMGADAALGKAERKLCKRVHDVLLGMTTPDADLSDAIDVPSSRVQTSNVEVRVEPRQLASINSDDAPADAQHEAQVPAQEAPAEPAPNPRLAIIRSWLAESAISEPDAVARIHQMFPDTDSLATLDEIEAMRPQVINAISRPSSRATFISGIGGGK